jgi:hypothetical protein
MPGKPSQIASVIVDKTPHNLDPLSLQPSPRGPRPPSGPAWPVERPPKACSHAMEGPHHQRPFTVDTRGLAIAVDHHTIAQINL